MTTKAFLIELAKDIIVAAIIAAIIIQFVKPTIVKETSMENNFFENDYLFIAKKAYSFGKAPQRGDVIVFKSDLLTETGKPKLLIKRVIGVPGDSISIHDGQVYINGEPDDMSYTKDGVTSGEITEEKVADGMLFCMGDNRAVSIDSRSSDVGQVDEDRIVGKVVFRLFPFNKIGVIHNPYEK